MTTSIVIVGGGISGTATAWELARNGFPATLVEAGELASMASGWTLAGVRQSGRHPAELPLAASAVRRWAGLHEELHAGVEYRQGGNLRLALIPDDVPRMRQVVEDGNAAGIAMTYLDSVDEVHRIAPALTGDLFGASFCPTDGHANPALVVQAFAAAARRAGAEILTNTTVESIRLVGGRVTAIETSSGTIDCERLVVAAGVYTPRLLATVGVSIPIKVVHVPAIQLAPTAPILDQVLGIPDGGFAARQEVSGRFRITGHSRPWTAGQHSDESLRPTTGQIAALTSMAVRLIPGIADISMARSWGGLIDQTADALPVIEAISGIDGLVVATGFSGHGFCLGPVTGEILADLAVEGVTRHPIAPFTLARLKRGNADESAALHG